jgi:Lon-like ATP-dependent protease
VEIFFRPLMPDEVCRIAKNAAQKIDFVIDDSALDTISRYATNGRESVNIVQIAAGVALNERRHAVTGADIEWVVNFGQYSPRPDRKIPPKPQIGFANGLAVYGPNVGTVMEIEVTAEQNRFGNGRLTITGVVDEEEFGTPGRTMRRKSMAKGSLENVLTVLSSQFSIEWQKYDIHVNFPGGGPVDGPSAGITVATAIYSAIKKIPIDNTVAMTGEISIRGFVKPVGGVSAKIAAAIHAGARKVIIPKENWQEIYKTMDIEVIAVDTLEETLRHALVKAADPVRLEIVVPQTDLLTAAGIKM